jgi:hypothetical protein
MIVLSSPQNKLTVDECRKYLPAERDYTDEEIVVIRDSWYDFAEAIMMLDRKEIA